MALSLEHQTVPELLARIRRQYRELRRHELAQLAVLLYDCYVAGDFTETQIRDAFDLTTDIQWNNFRNRVLTLRNAWIDIKSAEGE